MEKIVIRFFFSTSDPQEKDFLLPWNHTWDELGKKNQTTAETDSKIKGPSLNIENKIQIKGITHN